MTRGVVKFYNAKARYGFITPDDGSANVYFSEESLPLGRRYNPIEGDVVEFGVRTGVKGVMAVQINLDPDGIHPIVLSNGHAGERT